MKIRVAVWDAHCADVLYCAEHNKHSNRTTTNNVKNNLSSTINAQWFQTKYSDHQLTETPGMRRGK